MKLTFFFLLIFLSCSQLFAQNGSVSGKCTDKKGRNLENVKVYVQELSFVKYTNENGDFETELPANISHTLIFRYDTLELRREVLLSSEQKLKLKNIVFPIQDLKAVDVNANGNQDIIIFKLPKLDIQTFPSPSVERTLIYTTAASSNNELTSNYNVRGGNYDENLVYVNDFLINRPFLTRSGQQEGLSFINTALVEEINFSAGGFDSRYGDKLSSVLDIKYKNPDSLNLSLMASLLGVETHAAHRVSPRLNYLVGLRYRANGYLLNSLPTKGAYNPVFYDGQVLLNYNISENLVWSTIAHFSSNDYRFSPETQQTDFGTVNEAYRFNIYFDGQEQTRFQTITTGTALKWKVSDKTQLDFYASLFNTNEQENFDIQGQYFINQLETDPSKAEFGDSIATLGVGTFLNHARNQLQANIINIYHNGFHQFNSKSKLSWGVNYQKDQFVDVLSEWKMIDSAGFSLPQSGDNTIMLFETIKSNLSLQNNRVSGFSQFSKEWGSVKKDYLVKVKQNKKDLKEKVVHEDTISASYSRLIMNAGVRAGYTEVNNEFYVTPRFSLAYFPRSYFYNNGSVRKRSAMYKFSTGLYYQPPFYREFRTFDGQLNLNVKSQKSFHVVGGYDFLFTLWGRDKPFKFSSEAYYKYMWDVNPYEVDNVRTRYYARNMATAYAYGLDFNLHGEFVKGIESFFKIGFLSTKEDIKEDKYTLYYNQKGERIYFGVSEDQVVVDSAVINASYIPRPTDQLVNFAILFQDNMPGYESFSVQLGLLFGSRLPYGPPDFERYKDTLRQKSYFRTDIGLSYDLLRKKKHEINNTPQKKSKFSDAIISFEVFNLMGINNVLSKQWIQDVSGKYYSIPNYLTQRRFNLKLILRI